MASRPGRHSSECQENWNNGYGYGLRVRDTYVGEEVEIVIEFLIEETEALTLHWLPNNFLSHYALNLLESVKWSQFTWPLGRGWMEEGMPSMWGWFEIAIFLKFFCFCLCLYLSPINSKTHNQQPVAQILLWLLACAVVHCFIVPVFVLTSHMVASQDYKDCEYLTWHRVEPWAHVFRIKASSHSFLLILRSHSSWALDDAKFISHLSLAKTPLRKHIMSLSLNFGTKKLWIRRKYSFLSWVNYQIRTHLYAFLTSNP